MSSDGTTIHHRASWHYYLVRLPSGRPPAELTSLLTRCFSARSPLVTAQVDYLGTLHTRSRWSAAHSHVDQLMAKNGNCRGVST